MSFVLEDIESQVEPRPGFARARLVLLTALGAESFECSARLASAGWVEVCDCPELTRSGARSTSFPTRRVSRVEWL